MTDKISDRLAVYVANRRDDDVKRKNWFHYRDVAKELGLRDAKDEENIRVQLTKLAANTADVVHHHKDRGLFKVLDVREPSMMNFATIDPSKTVDYYLPFHLEDFFKIYPSNVFCCAGVSNYGKTEFLLTTAYLNQHHPSVFFNTDAEAEETLDRINQYQPFDAWTTKFPRKVTAEEIPEMIRRHYPNDFVYLDYLKVTKEYYEINDLIERCGQAMDKGVLFIGLQKNKGVDWARGGQQTLDLARFYVTLDPGAPDRVGNRTFPTTELKIVKMKMLRHRGQYNPNQWKFIYRMVYYAGDIPTYKMIYAPPGYVEYQQSLKQKPSEPSKPVEINTEDEPF